MDQVFSHGFAYRIGEKGQMEGFLKHKKALLISTTMGLESAYKASGIEDAMKKVDVATLSFVWGIQNVEHVFLYAVATNPETRKGHLDWARRLGKEF